MILSPGQRFALQEMGIPVWELRESNSDKVENTVIEQTITTEELNPVELQQAKCLVLVDQQSLDAESERLLYGMLRILELPENLIKCMSPQQFSLNKMQCLTSPNLQLIVLLGDGVVQEALSVSATENRHGTLLDIDGHQVKAVYSDSLMELMKQPEKKYRSWKSLSFAKSYLKNTATHKA